MPSMNSLLPPSREENSTFILQTSKVRIVLGRPFALVVIALAGACAGALPNVVKVLGGALSKYLGL